MPEIFLLTIMFDQECLALLHKFHLTPMGVNLLMRHQGGGCLSAELLKYRLFDLPTWSLRFFVLAVFLKRLPTLALGIS